VCCDGCGRWWWVSLLLGGGRPSSSSSWFDFASAFALSAIATTTQQDDIDANSSSMGMLHFDLHLDPAINDLSGKQMMMILSCWSTSTESFLCWVGEFLSKKEKKGSWVFSVWLQEASASVLLTTTHVQLSKGQI
jgi:hypothetical protein